MREQEKEDMQQQIRKLLQACMEEERESECARRREASAREQLARLNSMVPHATAAVHDAVRDARIALQASGGVHVDMPSTPANLGGTTNDPMYLGFGEVTRVFDGCVMYSCVV